MGDEPVAIVTGAGSGIGRATARTLSGAGWRVALAGRRVSELEKTGAELSAEWLCVGTDVSQATDVRRLIDMTVGRWGHLDLLVNNAGVAPLLDIDKTDDETIRRVFAVNALGPAYAIARAWPTFLAQKRGCIVNISTMGVVDPFPGFFAYAAAKASVESMVRSCAKEGREHNVRAFAIAPGVVETPMLRELFTTEQVPPAATLQPEAIAASVLACAQGERDDMSGKTIHVA